MCNFSFAINFSSNNLINSLLTEKQSSNEALLDFSSRNDLLAWLESH